MPEYVTLLGAEDVLRAGRTISEAAGTMVSAAEANTEAVYHGERVLESFIHQFEALVDRLEKAMKP
jgi:hypothetical protein